MSNRTTGQGPGWRFDPVQIRRGRGMLHFFSFLFTPFMLYSLQVMFMSSRSCNDCAKRKGETCHLLGEHPDCSEFYPAPDPVYEPWRPRSHPEDGEYNDEPEFPISPPQFDSIRQFDSAPVKLFKGQKLYYRNKFTGKIESVMVTGVGHHKFWFWYNGAYHSFSYSEIGSRLYLSYEGALKLSHLPEN